MLIFEASFIYLFIEASKVSTHIKAADANLYKTKSTVRKSTLLFDSQKSILLLFPFQINRYWFNEGAENFINIVLFVIAYVRVI